MGRPPNADADKTRRDILSAATRAFGSHGLAGCTVRDIAEDVGLTFAAVHHHFGKKEALYEACLDRAFADFAEIAQEIAAASARAAPGEQIAAGVRSAFRAALENPDRSRLLLRAFVFDQRPSVRDKLERGQRLFTSSATSLLDQGLPYGTRIPVVALGMLITRFAVGFAGERTFFAEEVGDEVEAMEAYLVHVAEQTLRLKEIS